MINLSRTASCVFLSHMQNFDVYLSHEAKRSKAAGIHYWTNNILWSHINAAWQKYFHQIKVECIHSRSATFPIKIPSWLSWNAILRETTNYQVSEWSRNFSKSAIGIALLPFVFILHERQFNHGDNLALQQIFFCVSKQTLWNFHLNKLSSFQFWCCSVGKFYLV